MVADQRLKSRKAQSFKVERLRKDSQISSSSTDFQSSQHSRSGDRQKEEAKLSPTLVMRDRWQRSNALLPETDRQDILEEHPCFNKGKKSSPEQQHHPEFTQCSYLRIRSLEEVYPCRNYFEDLKKSKSASKKHHITEHVRSFGIQKIFDLH